MKTQTLLHGCMSPCEDYLHCDHPCESGCLAILVRRAIRLNGMTLGEALRVTFAVAMGGGYPLDDARLDKKFLDLMDRTGPYSSQVMEEAFYDSL